MAGRGPRLLSARFPSPWMALDGRWAPADRSHPERTACGAGRATLPVLQLPVSGSRLCLYEDGTEVTDDYFPGLPNDAELLLLTAGQTWQGCK